LPFPAEKAPGQKGKFEESSVFSEGNILSKEGVNIKTSIRKTDSESSGPDVQLIKND